MAQVSGQELFCISLVIEFVNKSSVLKVGQGGHHWRHLFIYFIV